jgi:hypothetical protein
MRQLFSIVAAARAAGGIFILSMIWLMALAAASAHAQQPLADAQEVWGTYNRYTRSVLNDETLLQRCRAAELPQVDPQRVVAVAPAVRKQFKLTGEHKEPVTAVRCDAAGPAMNMPA